MPTISSEPALVAYSPSDPLQGNFVNALGTVELHPDTNFESAVQNATSTYGLTSGSSADASAATWYAAQSTYAANTNGASLEDALAHGDTSGVQTALAQTFPAAQASQSAPSGLSGLLNNIPAWLAPLFPGLAAPLMGAGVAGSQAGTQAATSTMSTVGTLFGDVENWFERSGLIIIGGIVIIVSLWMLLSSQGVVPSIGSTARAVS